MLKTIIIIAHIFKMFLVFFWEIVPLQLALTVVSGLDTNWMEGCKTDTNDKQFSDCQNTNIKKYIGIHLCMKHVKNMLVSLIKNLIVAPFTPTPNFFPTLFALEAR